MDFSKIYRLSKTFASGTVIVNLSKDHDFSFDELKSIGRGEKPIDSIIGLKKGSRGKYPGDYLDGPWVYLNVFSNKVFEALDKIGATGWRSLPVYIQGFPEPKASDYRILVVTGRSGEIDYSRSKPVRMRMSPERGLVDWLIGQMFDPSSWDGSDIFFPGNTAYIYVTERVKIAIEAVKAKGIKFTPIDEYAVYDTGQMKKITR